MSTVDSITSSASSWYATESGVDSVEDRTALDKDDFLALMVAQLQNQDPLEPASNQEFAAQLAQYTSLEQMMQMNETMETSLTYDELLYQAQNNGTASNFIGKEVHAVGNIVAMEEDEPVSLRFYQDSASVETAVDIYNSDGTLVRTISLENVESGASSVEWDGQDEDGNQLDSGSYYFNVTATDAAGSEIDVTTFTVGTVTGLTFSDGQAYLLVDGNALSLANIMEVVDPGSVSSTLQQEEE